jgi:hypothetical protein
MINNKNYKLWFDHDLKNVSYKPIKKIKSSITFGDYQSRRKYKDHFVDNLNYKFVGRKPLFKLRFLSRVFTEKFNRPVI